MVQRLSRIVITKWRAQSNSTVTYACLSWPWASRYAAGCGLRYEWCCQHIITKLATTLLIGAENVFRARRLLRWNFTQHWFRRKSQCSPSFQYLKSGITCSLSILRTIWQHAALMNAINQRKKHKPGEFYGSLSFAFFRSGIYFIRLKVALQGEYPSRPSIITCF